MLPREVVMQCSCCVPSKTENSLPGSISPHANLCSPPSSLVYQGHTYLLSPSPLGNVGPSTPHQHLLPHVNQRFQHQHNVNPHMQQVHPLNQATGHIAAYNPMLHNLQPGGPSRRCLFNSPCQHCVSPLQASPSGRLGLASPLVSPVHICTPQFHSPDCSNVSSTVQTPTRPQSMDSLSSPFSMPSSQFVTPIQKGQTSNASTPNASSSTSTSAFKDPNKFLRSAKAQNVTEKRDSVAVAEENSSQTLEEDSITNAADSLNNEEVPEPVEEEIVASKLVSDQKDTQEDPSEVDNSNSTAEEKKSAKKSDVTSSGILKEQVNTAEMESVGVITPRKRKYRFLIDDDDDENNDSCDFDSSVEGTTTLPPAKSKLIEYDVLSTADQHLSRAASSRPKSKTRHARRRSTKKHSRVRESSGSSPLQSRASLEQDDVTSLQNPNQDVLTPAEKHLPKTVKNKQKLQTRSVPGRDVKRVLRSSNLHSSLSEKKTAYLEQDDVMSIQNEVCVDKSKTSLKSGSTQQQALPVKEKKPIFLKDWYFLIYSSYLTVEGYREYNGANVIWHSGPIVEVLAPHQVKTKSSSEYVLVGKLDFETAITKGASVSMARHFIHGFPDTWKTWLLEKTRSQSQENPTSRKNGSSSRAQSTSFVTRSGKGYGRYDEVTDRVHSSPRKQSHSKNQSSKKANSISRSGRGRPSKSTRVTPAVREKKLSSKSQSKSSISSCKVEPLPVRRSSRGRIVKPLGTNAVCDFFGNILNSSMMTFDDSVSVSGPRVYKRPCKRKNASDLGDTSSEPDASVTKSTHPLEVARALDYSDSTAEEDEKKGTEHEVSEEKQECHVTVEEGECGVGDCMEDEIDEIEIPVQSREPPSQVRLNQVEVELRSSEKPAVSPCETPVQSDESTSTPVPFPSIPATEEDTTNWPSTDREQRRVRFSDVHEYGPQGTTTYSIGESFTSSSTSSGTDESPPEKDPTSSTYSFRKIDSQSSDSESFVDDMGKGLVNRFVTTRRSHRNRRDTDFGEVINWDSLSDVLGEGRSRKKKSAKLPSSKNQAQPFTLASSVPEVPMKRKRGRPPKKKTVKMDDDTDAEMDTGGSNPIHTPKDVQVSNDSNDDTLHEWVKKDRLYQFSDTKPVKKKRGRPPKNKTNEMDSNQKQKPATLNSRVPQLTLPSQDMQSSDESASFEWGAKARIRLFNIVNKIPPTTPAFWSVVAKHLGSRYSAKECQFEYQNAASSLQQPTHKLRTRKKVEAQNNPVLVANKGTLKRKGQLRDIVTMMDKDYSDDILESTPMRENRFHLPLVSSDSEDDFENHDNPPHKTPVHPLKRSLKAPVLHTPKLSDILDSPDLLQHNRTMADKTIYHIQKGYPKYKSRSHKASYLSTHSKKESKGSSSFGGQQISTLADMQMKTADRLNQDDEETGEELFSELEENVN